MLLCALSVALGRLIGGYLYEKFGAFLLAASLGGGAMLLSFCADSMYVSLFGIFILSMSSTSVVCLSGKLFPRTPALCFSAVLCSSYLGYMLTRLVPVRSELALALLPVACGVILLVFAGFEVVMAIKRAVVRSEEEKFER